MAQHNNKKEQTQSAQPEEKEPPKEKVIVLKEEEFKKLQEEVSQAKECQGRMLRLQADFENARKRMEKQCQDFTKYANEEVILELLTILDDLERTTQLAENKGANLEVFLKGIEMILSHLYEMLKVHAVRPIEVIGKPFDPLTSEALMQIESGLAENTVVEEMQKGYFLNDRVIRTSKVKVAVAKPSGTVKIEEIGMDKKIGEVR